MGPSYLEEWIKHLFYLDECDWQSWSIRDHRRFSLAEPIPRMIPHDEIMGQLFNSWWWQMTSLNMQIVVTNVAPASTVNYVLVTQWISLKRWCCHSEFLTTNYYVAHLIMPQSHPTTGPVRFLSPVRFLAPKAEWSARGNFTSVLSPWSHQATGPVRLDTAAYLWFGWRIRRTPRVPRVMPVRVTHGNLQCFSYPTGPVRDPQGCRTAPLRTRKGNLK